MTGQSLLDRMELVNAELQLQSGEVDVTKGLVALNVAQDFFESLAAQRKGILGGSTAEVTTTASTESTSFPTGFLRIDRLQLLGSDSLPAGDLRPLYRAGGHSANAFWYLNLISSVGIGKPHSYWTDGSNIYWQPLPNGTHTIRVYGFKAADDISAAGTFAYPDVVAFPLAAFAVKLIKIGLDDDGSDVGGLAYETFTPVLDALGLFHRDGAKPLEYTMYHQE